MDKSTNFTIRKGKGIAQAYRNSKFPNINSLSLLECFKLSVELRELIECYSGLAIIAIGQSDPGCEKAQCSKYCPIIGECRAANESIYTNYEWKPVIPLFDVELARYWRGRQVLINRLAVERLKYLEDDSLRLKYICHRFNNMECL